MTTQSYGWNLQRLQHSRNKSLDHTDDVHELCFSQLSTFSVLCYRHHLSYGDCLEAEMEDNQNCCVLCCVRHTCKQFLELICTLVVFRFVFCVFVCVCYLPFSVLTLLFGRQEDHPAYKNWVMRCWCGCLSGARSICSSWCRCHPKAPSSFVSFKSSLVLPF